MKLRSHLVIAMTSLIVSSLLVVGIFTVTVSRRGMTRLASEQLSFKAEEIRKFAWNQWDVLVTNGLTELPLFREAVLDSVNSYARTVVREGIETVTAFDQNGQILFASSESGVSLSDDDWNTIRNEEGIFRLSVDTTELIGYVFQFDPLEWTVLTSVPVSQFFAEPDEITITLVAGSLLILVTMIALLLFVASRIATPVTEIASGMREISRSRNFDTRLPARGFDEVRYAATAFNTMSIDLKNSYQRLREIAVSEAKAHAELDNREIEALLILGRLSDYNDHETGLHIIRVGLYSMLLAQALGIPAEESRLLYRAAPLHDVGKIAVPKHILLKPGPLDNAERETMQQHTIAGHRILSEADSPSLKVGAEIALTHHEKYNGCGYPNGLSGTDIPLFSRILAVADVFDAVTTPRPYKDPWPLDRAFELVQTERGEHFDPTIADLFLQNHDKVIDVFMNAELTDGRN